ncbi:ATP-binding protein [Aliiglaciecola sp. LCG003]|uniref:sensor histidine kinase n=1 Tax=Aliiglaciecola sp. LCG003 TaxID=3053655 RepID=UPI002572B18A|nr:ATP-binding protein [Aliiglaciecola sp. LCG003]WJG10767.1 histidine kinase dimerization/phospho-acceptor domain-containing protein [Aliiglaciecola sp. LCG003]
MSLRLRLTLLVAAVFLGFWLVSSIWLVAGLRSELDTALDQRLQSTASMLSNLLATVPENALGKTIPSLLQGNEFGNAKGLSCQISSLYGSVLASSNTEMRLATTEINEGFSLISSENSQWRTFALQTDKFIITIADSISERESLHFNLLKSTLLPPVIALLASLALLWIAVGRGLLPIKNLVFAVERRGSDDLSPVELDKPSPELQPLVASQNALLKRLSEGMQREQQFTNSAAHELRTPLAGILSQIQLAELSTGTAQAKALKQAHKSAHRLHSILDNLLALARVDSDQVLIPATSWSLGKMIIDLEREVCVETHQISYQVTADCEIKFVPKPLIAIVCRNVLENALKYSVPDSVVTLSAQSTLQGLKIEVRNTGNVNQEDIPHLTSRFWRKGERQGAGLGLSIVNAIATKYNGSLGFENQGPDFLVTFYLPAVSTVYTKRPAK